MYKESAGRIFLKYAVLQMIGLLFNSVYVIVDGIFIGMRLGSAALAAAGVAVPVVELLIALSIGMTSGAGVLISGRLASGNFRGARSAFMNALLLQGLFAAVIAVFGNVFMVPLASGLGATADILGLTVSYLRFIVTLSPFLLFSYLLGGLARNDGRPKLAMTALSVGSLSSILLDYIFMYPLDMGISGAALATAVGPVISVAILLPHFLRKRGYLYFRKADPDRDTLVWFLRLGLPSFVMEFSIGVFHRHGYVCDELWNRSIRLRGGGPCRLPDHRLPDADHTYAVPGDGRGPPAGFQLSPCRRERGKLRELLKIAVFVFAAAGVLSYVLLYRHSLHFYRLFTPGDEALALFAAQTSRRYFIGFVCAGLNILAISCFQSTQASGRALLLSSLRGFILPGLFVLVIPLAAGASSLWICHSAAEVCTLLVCLALMQRSRT